MPRGATPRAEEMAGTAVLRIVVSSDPMKKATATSHGRSRLEASEGSDEDGVAINGPARFILRAIQHFTRNVAGGKWDADAKPIPRRLRLIKSSHFSFRESPHDAAIYPQRYLRHDTAHFFLSAALPSVR